ncbi:hypothetical protein [Streptomyces sp. NPDC060022]|uniref:hypothetical protein n=1 Tax=Streptomyces sp. NPDC060022 TaxID=3347039 RepID=UPI00368B348C
MGDVTHRPAEDVTLAVAVDRAPTAIMLTAPAEGTRNQSRVPVKRGTGTLTSAAVAADSTFRINDLPSARGEVVTRSAMRATPCTAPRRRP